MLMAAKIESGAEGAECFEANTEFAIPHAEFLAAVRAALCETENSHKRLATIREKITTAKKSISRMFLTANFSNREFF